MSRSRFSRSRNPRTVGRKVIIVCEGETEEIYFEAIRKSKKLQTLKIRVVNPDFSDPENIVKLAVNLRNEVKRQKNWLDKDEVWAIFDGEEHVANNIQNWDRALSLAAKETVNLGISNPSFELWYLLHYQNQTANIHRDAAKKRLVTHLPAYDKTRDFYESHFKLLTNQAITRARALLLRIQRDRLETYNNPSTQIHLLVEKLSKL
jgi:RloB-like protein